MPSLMKHTKQIRRLGLVLVLLVLLFGTMAVTARQRSEVTAIEKVVATILFPFQAATDWVAGKFRGLADSVQELANLRAENRSLRERGQELDQAAARYQQLVAENLRLRAELQVKQRAKYALLSAEVISRNPDNWFRTVTINRGSRDGVERNMAVVNWQGLVGKVAHTTFFTATVQLLIDPGLQQAGPDSGFGAGAKLPSGETGVIITLQGGHVRMRFFSSEPAVQVGQPIFTSGQGIIPPDLLIGYVHSIGNVTSALDRYADVLPAVDFHKLDLLHVVLNTAQKEASLP